jgi:hypothetical protein
MVIPISNVDRGEVDKLLVNSAEPGPTANAVFTEFIDLGQGQYIRRTFKLQDNPRLFFLNVLFGAAVTLVILVSLVVGFKVGIFLLLSVTGLFSFLRSYVEPKSVRGPLIRDELIVIDQEHLKLPNEFYN